MRCQCVQVTIGGRPIVDNVTVALNAGEVTALVGPNGAGKSTLLRVLSGDLRPTSGRTWIGDRLLHAFTPIELARERAVLPQHTNTLFSFTATDVVSMGRFPWESSASDDARITQDCLARVGVAHLSDRSFPTLSGGEQALVNLARILAQDTPIVLLDEPTAALDVGHQELVLHIADELAREGRTVALVAHDLNLAARFAHRVLVLEHGRLVADGTASEALQSSLLSRLYRHPIAVLDHPMLPGRPLVLPAPC